MHLKIMSATYTSPVSRAGMFRPFRAACLKGEKLPPENPVAHPGTGRCVRENAWALTRPMLYTPKKGYTTNDTNLFLNSKYIRAIRFLFVFCCFFYCLFAYNERIES